MKILIFFIANLPLTPLSILTVANHEQLQDPIMACVGAIILRYFKPGDMLMISEVKSNNIVDKDSLIRALHFVKKWPIVVHYPYSIISNSQAFSLKINNYVFISKCEDEVFKRLRHQIQDLERSFMWNPRGLFLMVFECGKPQNVTEDYIKIILKEFWNSYILHMDIVVRTSPEILTIYTGFPFQPNLPTCGEISDISVLDIWNVATMQFQLNTSLFPSKISLNMGKCRVRVAIGDFPPYTILKKAAACKVSNLSDIGGLDIKLLTAILEKLNLSAELSLHLEENPWGNNNSGIYEGLRGELLYKQSDIAISGWMYSFDDSRLFDFTKAYLNNKIAWFVPRAKSHPRWIGLLRVFDIATWCLIFFTVFAVASLLRLISSRIFMYELRESDDFISFAGCLFSSWSVLVGVSVPHPHTNAGRIVFVFWVCFCISVTTVFQAHFTSFLVDPGLENQINSIRDLIRSKMGFVFTDFQGQYIEEEVLKRLVPRYNCTSPTECVDIAKTRHIATLANRDFVSYLEPRLLLQDQTLSYHAFTNDMFEIPGVFYVRKGYPLLSHIDKIVSSIVESGLTDKFMNDVTATGGGTYSVRHFDVLRTEYTRMSLLQMSSAFYLLLLGQSLAVLLFLAELVIHWLASKPTNQLLPGS